MEEFGAWLTQIGLMIIPYSFAFYLPTRYLEYIWKRGYTRLVKAIWYLALGLTYAVGGLEVDYIVMYICFIEACDLIFLQLEVQRIRKQSIC